MLACLCADPTSHGQKSQVLLDRRAADAWMTSRRLPKPGIYAMYLRISHGIGNVEYVDKLRQIFPAGLQDCHSETTTR
jgi:hypothetical protein